MESELIILNVFVQMDIIKMKWELVQNVTLNVQLVIQLKTIVFCVLILELPIVILHALVQLENLKKIHSVKFVNHNVKLVKIKLIIVYIVPLILESMFQLVIVNLDTSIKLTILNV